MKLSLKCSFLLLITLSLVLLVGCSESHKDVINLYAASSLTSVVNDWVEAYEVEHQDVDIQVNFAGTNTLKLQIEQGADADLFLSANKKYYDSLNEAGFVHQGQCFAENKLCVITHKDNQKVKTFMDLTRNDVTLVLGEKEVPIGKYSLEVLNNANEYLDASFMTSCQSNVVSYESNVKRIVAKVALNEADAGIAYITDAMVDDDIVVLEIDDEINARSEYYQVLLKASKNKRVAKDFYEYLNSEAALKILENYGFIVKTGEN